MAVGAVLLFVFALALPAGAQEQDGGSITATVTVADQVCVLVSAEVLDFGVLDFDDSATSAPYAVESCSSGAQELYASGTDAANAADSVTWGLVDGAGTRAEDQFSVDASLGASGDVWLTSAAALVGVLGAGETADAAHTLLTPPAGSAGAGETLSFELVWLAVLAEPEP